ncbi:MAG: capsule assembly Wzi family protein [Bacteroidota bacterium]
MIKHICGILCLVNFISLGQSIAWEGKVVATGIFSSEEVSPFWIYTNSDTQYGAATHFSGLGEVKATYKLSENAALQGGTTLFFRDEVEDEFQRRDLYLQFTNTWLKATLGARKAETALDGLSVTNKNFLFSGNSRPLGGIVLEASDPLKISNALSVDWGIGHYALNDDRFVSDVRVHYKRLGVIANLNENNRITARIQHYVQWAGTSPVFGELPSDFEAFVDVFFARKSPEIGVDGEIENAVGNHLGTYFLEYSLKTEVGSFSAYHEHPFEDGSGTRLANFPDGVWGLSFVPKKNNWIQLALYEYIDTRDQSGSRQVIGGSDGYFGNNVYRSGWTYDGNVIGMPLILFDRSVVIDAGNSPFLSNRVQAHHFGLKGSIDPLELTVKSTFIKQLGTFGIPLEPAISSWSNYASIMYKTQKYGGFTLFGGLDTGELIDSTIGVGLSYDYSF